MNQPEKETIIAWMNGELKGDALSSIESWADENPAMAEKLSVELESSFDACAGIPQQLEPPHPDFLNAKIRQVIEQGELAATVPEITMTSDGVFSKLQWLLAPLSLAAMALCFFLGTQYADKANTAGAVAKIEGNEKDEDNVVYVPSEEVSVEQFDSDLATVIILEGLEPIADDDLAMLSKEAPKDSIRFIKKESREVLWY